MQLVIFRSLFSKLYIANRRTTCILKKCQHARDYCSFPVWRAKASAAENSNRVGVGFAQVWQTQQEARSVHENRILPLFDKIAVEQRAATLTQKRKLPTNICIQIFFYILVVAKTASIDENIKQHETIWKSGTLSTAQ